MIFESPENLLEQKINETLQEPEETLVSSLIELSLLKDSKKSRDTLVFSELYNLLGLESFTEVIQLLSGKTITFPTQESFKETILMVLCYYYRYVCGKSWEEVKSLVMEPDLQTAKFGIRCKQFDTFLKEMTQKHLNINSSTYDRVLKKCLKERKI